MDVPTRSDRTEKSWDHPWTTDEMRENRAEWNLAGDSGLLQHLQQFSDKLMTRANTTHKALNSLTSELDETIIFIDNITNTSLALANTQFIESRVLEDDIEAQLPREQQPEVPKTKDQLDAELIASIENSVRRGIAIMDEKYETLEVIASDSEDDGEIPIPSIILRPKDPYQDRPLPYVIGSEKWKNSSKIGLESSSSESEHQGDDDSETDLDDNMPPVSKPINLHNPRIPGTDFSSSGSNDYNIINDVRRHNEDTESNKNQDIFDSDSEATTAASSLPKNSSSAAPNFAEELAKRLGSVIPTQKSINTQIIGEPVVNHPKDDLFTPEEENLFGARSENLFSEPTGLFGKEASNSLWHDKPAKPFKSNVIPPSLDAPPPINNVSIKPKSAIDDLFGDGDSEDLDDIFSGQTSISKPFNHNNSPSSSLHPEERPRTDKLLSVGGIIRKEGMTTSTPETKDVINSLFDDDSKDVENIFSGGKKDWTGAKASGPEKKAGSTPAEASDTNNRKGPVGGVPLLGNIDIFASGKLRRQVSSDSSSSKSLSDLESSRDTVPNPIDDSNLAVSARSNDGNSAIEARNLESIESSGVSIRPPSIDVTANSNTSPNFQPLMTSSWDRTGDMYRERVGSDSLFAAKTLNRENENFLNNARIHEESSSEANPNIFEDTDEIFGPPPLPKSGSKADAKSRVRSLFDDSDTGDDLFSNTSSGSRSQKSTDIFSTTTIATSQSSDKSKIFKNRGLLDDDDEDESDIFGTKDSMDVNLFATKNPAVKSKQSEAMQDSSSTQEKSGNAKDVDTLRESLDSNFEKQNRIKDQQTAPLSAKVDSIFDDLDDDDLFSPSFGKKTTSGMKKSEAPSLFDDGTDDLFAAPTKPPAAKLEKTVESSTFLKSEETKESVTESGRKVRGQLSPKVMEQLAAKLDVAKTEGKGNVQSEKETKTEEIVEENIPPSKGEKTDAYSINKSKNLASKILDEMKTVQKSKLEPETKPGIAKKPELLRKLDRKLDAANKSTAIRKNIVSSKVTTESRSESIEETKAMCAEEFSSKSVQSEKKVSSSDEERSSRSSKSEIVNTEEEKSSVSSSLEESFNTNARREPPRTLDIRSSTTSVSSEKSSAVQRRVVSGKIANLMGRMSDLKILSPTDTPPVWRKNEERTDDDGDKDSEDGSCISTSKESPTLSDDLPKIIAPPPPPSPPEQKELEPAISFDVPVQVETLSVTASKSRVRIQSKRRPQSRRARQNALRKSGIDFDTVDFSNDNDSDTNRNLSSNSTNNNPAVTENSTNAQNIANSNTDRLIISTGGGSENVSVKVTESTSSTFMDDRSEISFSKESSLSINKNTLLSPSTDEEDLFDVPPDLPEDPPKEDALFGRAPILSPVESFVKVQKEAKHESYESEKKEEGAKEETSVTTSQSRTSATLVTKESSRSIDSREKGLAKKTSIRDERSTNNSLQKEESAINKILKDKLEDKSQQDREKKEPEVKKTNRIIAKEEVEEGSIDPLRDSSHDPIKDPSNLFAFVTKSPSPEKGKNLLFNEDDDSLFSSSSSKKLKEAGIDEAGKGATNPTSKKPTLDIFADDADVDFFTTSLPKSTRKSKQSKIDLFGDDGNDVDDLFGGGAKKSTVKSSQNVTAKKTVTEGHSTSKKQSLFDDNSDETLFGSPKTSGAKGKSDGNTLGTVSDIFSDADNAEIFNTGKPKSTESTSRTSKPNVEDIFGNQSGGEEDMFAEKKMVIKKSTIPSGLFGDDDDDGGDIFGKSTQSATVSHSKLTETRGVVKRATTRDLRKTAEQIVEDPLSMLQND